MVKVNDESFPKISGEPRFEAGGTIFVLLLQLEAKKTCAMWLNARSFANFKDAGERSAVTYLLVFQIK